jgi:hypothetical protein
VEPDVRYYRRRASEELAAASRAVTEAARERRMIMAGIFLERLKAVEASCTAAELGLAGPDQLSAFNWAKGHAEHA